MSELSKEFFDALDEAPRTPTSFLVQQQGETRTYLIAGAAVAFRVRAKRFPRLERARNLLALLEALFEKEGTR